MGGVRGAFLPLLERMQHALDAVVAAQRKLISAPRATETPARQKSRRRKK
jgi:hypothetical protein